MAAKSSKHTHLNGRDLLSFLSLLLSFFCSRRDRNVSSHSADEHGFEARSSDWRAAVDPSRLPAQGHLRGGGFVVGGPLSCLAPTLTLRGSRCQLLVLGPRDPLSLVPSACGPPLPAVTCWWREGVREQVLLLERVFRDSCECGRAGEHTFPGGRLGGSPVRGPGWGNSFPPFLLSFSTVQHAIVPAGPGELPSRSCVTGA